MSKKDSAAAELILSYLNEKNRPYSAQDVFGNLQKQHGLGKTAVVKAMEQLAQDGRIREKVYGKQKIYFADQSQFADVSDAELKQMDRSISELNSQVEAVMQSCRQLDTELKELNSSLTTAEMTIQIKELKAECEVSRTRLQKIKSATDHVTPEEREKVCKERSLYVKEWKKRKRLATDMMGAILEGYPKSKKEFLEEVGVETDEEHKVKIPGV
ncbi:homologous-pairing protein 2 homolog isoform X1 [Tachysurus fulvidraco]|uniref:homologous-pairing protein 2 homolog isoform X1 n=1 Tax=Tachysurus fulvidraco TaxID=1234273 RepID=UPI001FEE4942|nr:homologous-pairing protein 2 homolog isoform X1 [Tachysurus fulvidraco]